MKPRRRTGLQLLGAGCCALAASCGGAVDTLPPLGQVLLLIDTDAIVPPDPTAAPDPTAPAPLFDRLRVEILRDGTEVQGLISQAERDFAITVADFAAGPVSIGVKPEPGDSSLVARVKLFRGGSTVDGSPTGGATLETRVQLPTVSEEGVLHSLITLRTRNVGVPQEEPVNVINPDELPSSSEVGSWREAERRPCSTTPLAGEVCVPGGAFWWGDVGLVGNDDISNEAIERLVVVSPYFIDEREVSVRDFRKHVEELGAEGHVLPPEWNGSLEGALLNDYATFTSIAPETDPEDERSRLPVNGVLWETAAAYCALEGKQLPTEMMFEFLGSGQGAELTYVWGKDAPECDEVVAGRAGFGHYSNFNGLCRVPGTMGGVEESGAGTLDRVEVGDGLVLDLMGNLSEWTSDWFVSAQSGPFAEPGIVWNPSVGEGDVGEGDDANARVVKGGSWRGLFVELPAAARRGLPYDVDNRSVGFRCARPAGLGSN